MITRQLSALDAALKGYTHAFEFDYLDFAAMTGGTAGTLNFYPETGTALGGLEIKGAWLYVKTAGAHAGTLTISLGDATNGAAFSLAASDGKAVAGTNYKGAAVRGQITAGENIRITVTVGSSTPSAATAGAWVIFANIANIAELATA